MIDIRPVEPHVQVVQPVRAVRPVDKDAGAGNEREHEQDTSEQEPEAEHDLVELSEAYLAQAHPVQEQDLPHEPQPSESSVERHIDIEA